MLLKDRVLETVRAHGGMMKRSELVEVLVRQGATTVTGVTNGLQQLYAVGALTYRYKPVPGRQGSGPCYVALIGSEHLFPEGARMVRRRDASSQQLRPLNGAAPVASKAMASASGSAGPGPRPPHHLEPDEIRAYEVLLAAIRPRVGVGGDDRLSDPQTIIASILTDQDDVQAFLERLENAGLLKPCFVRHDGEAERETHSVDLERWRTFRAKIMSVPVSPFKAESRALTREIRTRQGRIEALEAEKQLVLARVAEISRQIEAVRSEINSVCVLHHDLEALAVRLASISSAPI